MGITNSNKEVNVSQITCGGTFQVTLGLSAAPDISASGRRCGYRCLRPRAGRPLRQYGRKPARKSEAWGGHLY